MSKPIISVAIMQLYERDLLDFDDEISKYIPEATGLKVALDRSKVIDSPT
jgi:CubicO group peptidase (beta-lactamase class C family)